MRFFILYLIFVSVNGLITIPKRSLPNNSKINKQLWFKSLQIKFLSKNTTMCELCKERPRKGLYCDECKI